METKVCKVCGHELPITEFANLHYGRSHTCNKCKSENIKKGRAKKNEIKDLRQQLEQAKATKLSEYTPRELMQELKRRGYEFTMTYTETHVIKSDNL